MPRRLLLLLMLTSILPAIADDAPTYPYELPDWYVKQRKALTTPVSLDYNTASLDDVAKDVGKLTKLRIDVEVAGAVPGGIALRVTALEAGSALKLISDLQGIKLVHDAGRIVLTDTPDRFPAPTHAAVRARIEQMRHLVHNPRKLHPDHTGAKARALCTGKTYAFAVEFATLGDALQQLHKATGAPLMAHPSLNKFHRVTAAFEGKHIEQIVDGLIAGSNSVRSYRDGKLMVSSKFVAKALADDNKRIADQLAKTKRMLAPKLEADLSGKKIPALVAALRTALGKPVHAGPRAWMVGDPLPKLTGKSLAEVARALDTIGVQLVPNVAEGAYYLIKR